MEAKSRREGEGAQTCSNKYSHSCCQKSCSTDALASWTQAALQVNIMQHLATPGHITIGSANMADIMQTVRELLPAAGPLTGWKKVFNPVATRFQQRLESFSIRSPYYAAAQTVVHRAVAPDCGGGAAAMGGVLSASC
eukprot:8314-Heterococcus_DN1.PRE.3